MILLRFYCIILYSILHQSSFSTSAGWLNFQNSWEPICYSMAVGATPLHHCIGSVPKNQVQDIEMWISSHPPIAVLTKVFQLEPIYSMVPMQYTHPHSFTEWINKMISMSHGISDYVDYFNEGAAEKGNSQTWLHDCLEVPLTHEPDLAYIL